MATFQLPASIPERCRTTVTSIAAGLPAHRAEQLQLRIERWWPDLVAGLAVVYPDAEQVGGRALVVAARTFAERADDLHTLDARRDLEPDWFQNPRMVGYAAYAERFARTGDLAGVAAAVEHLRSLGVSYLHLMPLLRPRPNPNDGGYAVADYREVREDLGTVEDLRELARRLRAAGISLCLDLVLNHVAREHPWAQAARDGDPHYRDYFYVYDDRSEPDAYERTLPQVFPDFAPGNFTHDRHLDGWVWTTFNDYQWDLAWSNPDVFIEMADVICFLANLGVEIIRLDAIAFIWKRLGTSCQNQPEVHALTQALRAITRIACPAVIFKAEAIVGPDDLVAYLGQGHHHGKVSDLAYHNALMVHIWSMLASRDAGLATHALARIPDIPSRTTWITYVRCHDDIGWAIDDADASAANLSGHGHRSFLSDFYSGQFPGAFADGLVFQFNPDTGDRRISGTTASLCGLGRSDDPAVVDPAVARLLLGYAIIFGFGGIPVIWSGDEIASLNDAGWADDPAHAADNRWAHRPRLDWEVVAAVTDGAGSGSVPDRVWSGLRHLVRVRQSLPLLHGHHASRPVAAPDSGLFAVTQQHPAGTFLGLYNITEDPRPVPTWWVQQQGLDPYRLRDHLADTDVEVSGHDIWLGGYQPMWLSTSP